MCTKRIGSKYNVYLKINCNVHRIPGFPGSVYPWHEVRNGYENSCYTGILLIPRNILGKGKGKSIMYKEFGENFIANKKDLPV